MPIKVKYVGPLDDKTFRGYFFKRNVTDNAIGSQGIVGEDAVELPDNVANEALKHREVFMQWNMVVPAAVKALRGKRVDAMRKEGEDGRKHWYKRLVVAEMLEDDTPRKAQIRANEMAGAKAEVDRFEALLKEADKLAERVLIEDYDPTAAVADYQASPKATAGGADEILAILAGYREALENEKTNSHQLRAELVAMKEQMQRDGRLSQDEEVSAPSTLDAEPYAAIAEAEAKATEAPAEDFADIFPAEGQPKEPEAYAVATPARRGRRPAAG